MVKKQGNTCVFRADVAVPARRHRNPDGSLGGWVAETAKVAASATVGPLAEVFGAAVVRDGASVLDRACVYGIAKVSGRARVVGEARVCGSAEVTDAARVADRATVAGHAFVGDSAGVSGDSYVHEQACIREWAYVSGCMVVRGTAIVRGDVKLFGENILSQGEHVEMPLLMISGRYMPIYVASTTSLTIGCTTGSFFWWARQGPRLAVNYREASTELVPLVKTAAKLVLPPKKYQRLLRVFAQSSRAFRAKQKQQAKKLAARRRAEATARKKRLPRVW